MPPSPPASPPLTQCHYAHAHIYRNMAHVFKSPWDPVYPHCSVSCFYVSNNTNVATFSGHHIEICPGILNRLNKIPYMVISQLI